MRPGSCRTALLGLTWRSVLRHVNDPWPNFRRCSARGYATGPDDASNQGGPPGQHPDTSNKQAVPSGGIQKPRTPPSWHRAPPWRTNNPLFTPKPKRWRLRKNFSYTCTVPAEPVAAYKAGGYAVMPLGKLLKRQKYKLVHKLGWGRYSTVWAAIETRGPNPRTVAVKICMAGNEDDPNDPRRKPREGDILSRMVAMRNTPAGDQVLPLLDHFDILGWNGQHECFVFEIMGPTVQEAMDGYFPGGRLPAKLAKRIAVQVLSGLQSMHNNGIAHGDLRTGNVAFTAPLLEGVEENQLMDILGEPELGEVSRTDGLPPVRKVPKTLVRPASVPYKYWETSPVKIIDFGESFLRSKAPETLDTALAVRAPEVIFKEEFDHRVDLWSLGCFLFELFVGQPPFDSLMTTPKILVGQMQGMASDRMSGRWMNQWKKMQGEPTEPSGHTLEDWLEEMYFDGERKADLTKEDIAHLAQLIGKLLRFEPMQRASAQEILDDPWFKDI
ncbi:kinase-like domain-containing protein [Aspergillus unguis]